MSSLKKQVQETPDSMPTDGHADQVSSKQEQLGSAFVSGLTS